MTALGDPERVVAAIERVRKPDARHREAGAVALGKILERPVEAAGTQEKPGVQHLAAAKAPREAVFGDLGAALGVIEPRLGARAIGRDQSPGCSEAGALEEHPGRIERAKVTLRQPREPRARERDQCLDIEARRDRARIDESLQRRLWIHPPRQDPGAVEVEEAVDEHLGAGIEPALEWRATAERLDRRRVARAAADRIERAPEHLVALLAQLQRIDDRIAHLADAKLQRPAILDEGGGVEPDRVLGDADREVRWTVEVGVVARVVDEEVAARGGYDRIAEHERQVAVDRGDEKGVAAARARRVDHRQ